MGETQGVTPGLGTQHLTAPAPGLEESPALGTQEEAAASTPPGREWQLTGPGGEEVLQGGYHHRQGLCYPWEVVCLSVEGFNRLGLPCSSHLGVLEGLGEGGLTAMMLTNPT